MRGFPAVVVIVSIGLLGCKADLGECDMPAARTLVYDQCGLPANIGQALMQSSCGHGSKCHSEAAEGGFRYGAPHGLNWDMRLAVNSFSAGEPPQELQQRLDVLRRGQRNVFEERALIWHMVDTGTMPPFGESTEEVYNDPNRPTFHREDDSPLLGVDMEREADELRNWLVCGVPIIERSVDGPETIGDYEPQALAGAGCFPNVEPNWNSIWNGMINPYCAGPCHNSESGLESQHMLLMTDQSMAYDNLVGTASMGVECGDDALQRVVPGDPMASLLYLKIAGLQPCGSRMPLGGPEFPPAVTEPVRAWIAAGARE